MSGQSIGRRRRRVYERKFDWGEARARYAAGETCREIGKSYGVSREAIQRVVHMPAHLVETATHEQIEALAATGLRRDQKHCPRCARPHSRHAELCRDCFNETRLDATIELVKEPGEKRVVLADVEAGRIIRVGDEWGVVCRGGSDYRCRVVDFWWGGRELVRDTTIVETAPTTRVYLAGVEEQPEEIVA